MSAKRFALAALAASLIALPAAARPKSGASFEDVLRKIQAQQQATTSIQAEFRQEKTLALLSKPEISSGEFVYSKPNNVLWLYESPKRVQMLITGGVLTTYYPDLNKAERIGVKGFEDRIFKYLGASGAIDELSKYFDFTFTDNASAANWILDLSPKTKPIARRVKHIRIWIDKKSYLTSAFEYVEADGDSTRYEFTNVRVNQPIAQSRFSLNLPNSVRVEQMKVQ